MGKDYTYRAVFRRGDKLLMLTGGGILVMKAWPPAAWTRTSPGAPWVHCRPVAFDLNLGKHEQRLTYWRDGFDQRLLAACREAASQPKTSDLAKGPERVDAILARLLSSNFATLDAPPSLERLPRTQQARIHRILRLESEYAEAKAFFEQIPEEVRRAVAAFPERHYSLVALCARCPGGLDLLRSTPALAMMLANCWCFGRQVKRPLRSARTLLRKPQRDQLAWLGFRNPGKGVIRALRKVPVGCCSVQLLLYLRDALNNEQARARISHLPRLNRGVVLFVSDPNLLGHVSHAFLCELATLAREETRAHIGHDMRRWLTLFAPGNAAPDLHFNSVHDFQNEYANAFELLFMSDLSKLAFPEAPVPGAPGIIPIESPLDLVREGREQHHCIASYAETIARGGGYAYKIDLPGERATLFIEPESRDRKHWRLAECHGFANADVPTPLWLKLMEWIDTAQPPPSMKPEKVSNGQLLLPGLDDSPDAGNGLLLTEDCAA